MTPKTKNLLTFHIVLFAILFLFQQEVNRPKLDYKEINFNEFVKIVNSHQVESVVIKSDKEIVGTYKEPVIGGYKHFRTEGDTKNPRVFEILENNNLVPSYVYPDPPSPIWGILLTFLPIFLIIAAFVWFARRVQSNSGNSISHNRAKFHREAETGVRFDSVAGADEAKEELVEIVDYLRNPMKFVSLGGEMPKGVLLVGPPGTGKTLLAKAVAGEAKVPFFSISGSDFVEMFVGIGAARVRSLFQEAAKHSPCIIFIDEIDAVGKQRGMALGHNDEREQTLNQLLVEMDGFSSSYGIIVIGATNRVDVLDKALLRPGRFDRHVYVNNPDVKGRESILKVHVKKVKLSKDVDLSVIAKGTSGFSGADLKNLVNEAALAAAKANKYSVEMVDFEQAKDKILMGAEKRSLTMTDHERRITAYHEAGHTLVGKFMKNVDPIHKVTIVPRGMSLGLTQLLPQDDRVSMSKERIEDNIALLMGGRIAEELVMNSITTGASNDIERATDLARHMVCEWGMSSRIGPVKRTEEDRKHMKEINEEIRNIVTHNYWRAKKIIEDNMEKLHNLANALLEKETIDGIEVEKIVPTDTDKFLKTADSAYDEHKEAIDKLK
jgi:cell division protease FtsH